MNWLNRLSFTTRLTLALALLLLGFAALVAVLGRQVAHEHEQESLQRLSHGLARHIVEHWPEITQADPGEADRAARAALLQMLMVVNPGIQVYVLDATGRVRAYIGEPGMVRQHQVDLQPVRDFLAGAALPLRGTDPIDGSDRRIFSAAMFAPAPGQAEPPGYLYIVLDGAAHEQVAGQISLRRVWQSAAMVAAIGLALTLMLGGWIVAWLARPLRRLAARMQGFSLQRGGAAPLPQPAAARRGNEITAIALAYDEMTARIASQADREQTQANAHREMMASVAHDLRTPLTALHGHLEALAASPAGSLAAAPAAPHAADPPWRDRVIDAALAQSNKVRRLSQQLFELAALQSDHQVLHRERFSLDELVADAVQKFELGTGSPPVTLGGEPPGRLELDGDLHLIERALSNLIDNAMRHAPDTAPVRVSLRREGASAQVLVEDAGPGLPQELLDRLDAQQSLRDPPIRRSSGGIGGLGLAIAQRVALLHGGSLKPLPAPQGGTRLCLQLPLA
jgi:signal transduction histidine kinase